ncbi:TetR/AcrR family transcriptional regulator [Allokutzneria albata]|uniref:DNA-binding transcriptional regulator, AcrR family n=1 Tax=Allokutzneria albata TaxID=211114 RepID=A0A1G9SLJ1_ALLAB|nr:TetR/AcrR family transcriptional regulator [Allokutzneria albata]SDM36358.1 DNA-binding transcriptional regulator, AcrR family [Allokutzneria albata]
MTAPRRERADAARNRRAILAATEDLLGRHRPDEVTVEQVAAAAGVGKGTVFHRFGSRIGLMTSLMRERALELNEAVDSGPPPLGPGAPPRERLLAFLSAVVDVVGRNKGLLAALGQAVAPRSHGEDHPVYAVWHKHVSTLITAERPGVDAPLLADLLLSGLHAEPVLRLLERGETARLERALHVLAEAVLRPAD